MSSKVSLYQYLKDGVSFSSKEATKLRTIYFPLCGPSADSLKSSISPFLSGDIKIDKNRFLTQPTSTEDLRNNVREFFVSIKGAGIVSLAKESPGSSAHIEIGQLWHKLVRKHPRRGVQIEATNFIPASKDTVELMHVRVKNISAKSLKITPTASIPIFARSLANKHDHEHVTSLLHRTHQLSQGVLVDPTMVFNEEGHQENKNVYYVFGSGEKGTNPVGSFPTINSFYGERGTVLYPEAIMEERSPIKLNDGQLQGNETIGALQFKTQTLKKGESVDYILALGISTNVNQAQKTFKKFNSVRKFETALKGNKDFWIRKSKSITFDTADKDFNSWMRWVTIQPVFRRIFGCSFLPDHDYGKGGRGWRDIWQDLLSLILSEPGEVRNRLINNFAGVRIDGSNATIIGDKPGEFLADRNAITRVWMDHGAWPLATLALYIGQTGDYDILLRQVTYFRDMQLSRTFEKDFTWKDRDGKKLRTKKGDIYKGTILEHLLVQNLVQFFNVGEHNVSRLEHADWNDGLDMAFDRGESVAFMSFYGGNLLLLADLIETIAQRKNLKSITLAKELGILLNTNINYDSAQAKRKILFQKYFKSVQPAISGQQKQFSVIDVVESLRNKGNWILTHIKKNQVVKAKRGSTTYRWFNGYYDNKARRVEGVKGGRVQMTLTGQVFPIMQGVANDDDIKMVVKSVDAHLKDKKLGGIRLNTDFGVKHYLDFGRAFGFAYGTKENGAFFSHMIVMYAYALYKRGFAREGHSVLQSIYQMSMNTQKSKIYPGVPEYFDAEGKGMYHYLTGSASWLVLTMLTQVFGVRGKGGDLILAPQLVREEFDKSGKARVSFQFTSKQIELQYINKQKQCAGNYRIYEVKLNGKDIDVDDLGDGQVAIDRKAIQTAPKSFSLDVILGT